MKVVVTCAASLIAPSSLDALKASAAGRYRFIGVDANPEPLSSCYLEGFYQVPTAADPGYLESLFKVLAEVRPQLLLVLSDAEAVVLSAPGIRRQIEQGGCLVLLPEEPVVNRCVDKGLFMDFLQQDPATAEKFCLVDVAEELRSCAALFGYPGEPFIVKPRKGCGSRGIMLVDASASQYDLLFGRNYRRFTLEFVEAALAGHRALDLLAMPFYSGADYNIDVLCRKGRVVYSMVQNRVSPRMGAIMTAQIVVEPDIDLLVERLVDRLEVSGLINIELARCQRTGVPRVYEINPRPSAAFAFLCYQKVDVLGDLAAVIRGGVVGSRRFSPMLVKRVWRQLYHD